MRADHKAMFDRIDRELARALPKVEIDLDPPRCQRRGWSDPAIGDTFAKLQAKMMDALNIPMFSPPVKPFGIPPFPVGWKQLEPFVDDSTASAAADFINDYGKKFHEIVYDELPAIPTTVKPATPDEVKKWGTPGKPFPKAVKEFSAWLKELEKKNHEECEKRKKKGKG